MPAERCSDDVILIRVDTGAAVQEFLDLLAVQAAEGETRAPANPANRAVFREIAPYRLVEYSYVDAGIGAIQGVYLGFPDGSIYAVADEIPEVVVDALVEDEPARMAPVYVYVVLEAPRTPECIDHFLTELSVHLGKALVGVFHDGGGALAAHGYDDGAAAEQLDEWVMKAVLEAPRHLAKSTVMERYVARSESPDGLAWAQITYDFAKHVLQFDSPAERNDFIEWSRTLCTFACQRRWEGLEFADILRPAEVAPAPKGEIVAIALQGPSVWQGARVWQAFSCVSAANATDDAALTAWLEVAREYWSYCMAAIAAGESAAKPAA